MARRLVERKRDGTFAVRLSAPERDLLRSVAGQLLGVVERAGEGEIDPSAFRLFPNAYTDRPDLDEEYQGLMRAELAEHHRACLVRLAETADAERLDAAGLGAWLSALNQARLVLGTRLDVREDRDDVPDDHPDAGLWAVYHWLTWLLDDVVGALHDSLGR